MPFDESYICTPFRIEIVFCPTHERLLGIYHFIVIAMRLGEGGESGQCRRSCCPPHSYNC
jgi:hypothetical protein